MTESDEIEEILMEASAINARAEVMEAAKQIINENPTIRKVDAYNQAYSYWFMHMYEKNING
jgi:hypothetical protein